jgi:hypothetical protein
MQATLRRVVRAMAGWPVVGRLIRILVALIRLPDDNDRQVRFANEQLPALLHTMSDLNARTLAVLQDPENFAQSIPVTLRTLTRDLAELRARIERLERQRGQ